VLAGARRARYLNALGLKDWRLRGPESGEKPEQPAQPVQPVQDAAAPARSSSDEHAPVSAREELRSSLAKAPPASAPAAVSASPAKAAPSLRLKLVLAQGRQFVLVDDRAPESEPEQARLHELLLKSILFALEGGQEPPHYEAFDWPPEGGDWLEEPGGGADALNAVLERKQTEQRDLQIILMAEALPAPAAGLPSWWKVSSARPCLAEPGRKRQLWQELLKCLPPVG